MTPEQQKHQEDYFIAKRRYENAFAEKRRAENEINNILNPELFTKRHSCVNNF